MTNSKPKVSVIVPVYNNAKHITQATKSVFAQTYTNWELIIVDDGSTDNSVDIIDELLTVYNKQSWKTNYRFIKSVKNMGVAWARNTGCDNATGDYIAFLDADDYWSPDKLELQVRAALQNKHDNYILLHTGVNVVIDDDTWPEGNKLALYLDKYFNHLPKVSLEHDGVCFTHMDNIAWSSVFITRSLFDKVHGFDEDLYNQNEDWVFVAKCKMYAHFYMLPKHLTFYRVHKDSYTSRAFVSDKKTWNRSIAVGQVIDKCVIVARRNDDKLSYSEFPRGSSFKNKVKNNFLYYQKHVRKHIRAKVSNTYHRFQHLLPCKESGGLDLLVLHITDKCNLGCKHCFLKGKLNKGNEMWLGDILDMASQGFNVNNVVITGGEPFEHTDISTIIHQLFRYSNVWVNTNGYESKRIMWIVENVVNLYYSTTFTLTVSVSLDGFEETHNKIRHNKKAYASALNTIRYLLYLRDKYPKLQVMVNTTITEENMYECVELAQEIATGFDVDYHNFEIARYNDNVGAYIKNLVSLERIYFGILDVIKKYYPSYYLLNKKKFEIQYNNVANNKDWPFSCLAGNRCFVIYPDWSYAACELREKLGNLKDCNFDIGEVIKRSDVMDEERNNIEKDKCFCTHGCWLSVSMLDAFRKGGWK